ncbi:MAG: RNA polymerase sigma factor [Planctomycetota bacterium]
MRVARQEGSPAKTSRATPELLDNEPATTTKPGQGISNLPGSLDQAAHAQDAKATADADELATRLMDEYRCSRSREVFDELIRLTRDQLMARVRSRVRFLSNGVDPEELLQDTIINIYRYPDRFDASRPGAFRAWSSTIVDNSVRRYLRNQRTGVDLAYVPVEMLAQERDQGTADPARRVAQDEASRQMAGTFGVFLMLYLQAYESLSDRERFVLHMVEVNGMRYADLAEIMTIRPEALKMVVFRARQRIMKRVARAVSAN